MRDVLFFFLLLLMTALVASEARAEYAECDAAEQISQSTLGAGGAVTLGLGVPTIVLMNVEGDHSSALVAMGISLLVNGVGMVAGVILGAIQRNGCYVANETNSLGFLIADSAVAVASMVVGTIGLARAGEKREKTVSVLPVLRPSGGGRAGSIGLVAAMSF